MRFLKKILPVTGVVLIGILTTACRHDPVGVESQPQVCFTSDVLPIFQNNCGKSGCHDGGGETRLDFSNADGILKNISPKQPLSSRGYTTIIDGNMPPSPSYPLSESQRTLIYLLILQGADTSCTKL
jgi:hypothetical protein